MSLEAALPPLHLAFISDNLQTASTSELRDVIDTLDTCIVTRRATRAEYLSDVIYLACRARCATLSQVVPAAYTVASMHIDHPGCGKDELTQLVMRHASVGVTPEAAALYRYSLAVTFGKTVETQPIADGVVDKLTAILHGYGADCKFQRSGDLFIWAIIQLRCPSWTCAALAIKDRPYAVASRVHTDNTNTVVHPLLTTGVAKLLHTLKGNELFCVMAAIAIEMTAATKSCLLINSHALSADPTIPSMAALNAPFEINGLTDVCGYMHHGVFHVASTPEQAVKAWATVYKPDSFLAKILTTEGVALDNPFSKFL